ncbi:MAG: hypothetical protein ACOX9C_06425 [Kiritimatiellia bacterium]
MKKMSFWSAMSGSVVGLSVGLLCASTASAVPPAGFNTWIASVDGKASKAANWSYGRAPIASDAVLFDGRFSTADCEWDHANGGGVATVASWTQVADYPGTVTFNTTFPAAGTSLKALVVTGDCIVSNGVWTHAAATAVTDMIANNYYRLKVEVGGAMTLATNAQINLTGKGAWRTADGGSHGGQGTFGTAFGSLREPTALGTSNGTADSPAFGGGALWLEVGGAFTMDGAIFADGTSMTNKNYVYAGSGGSVYIKAASMTGAGSVSANGFAGGASSGYCKNAASGGRIAILLTEASALGVPEANLTACGSRVTSVVAGAGTIVIQTAASTNGRLIVRDLEEKFYGENIIHPTKDRLTPIPQGQTWTLDSIVFSSFGILSVPEGTTLELPGGLASIEASNTFFPVTRRPSGLLIDGGTLVLPPAETHVIDGPWVFSPNGPYALAGDVVVTNGGGLGVIGVRSLATNDFLHSALTIQGDLSVSSNSYLLAEDAGLSSNRLWGDDLATIFEGTSYGSHGGEYGPEGYEYSTTETVYDSILDPALPGNGGAPNPGRTGGGLLKLKVDGTLTLDGMATARMSNYFFDMGGMGTINLTVGQLAGKGSITVDAVEETTYEFTYRPNKYSGGGRIAVRLTEPGATFSDWWKTNITAHGAGYPLPDDNIPQHSSAGTVYLQDATQAEGAGTVFIKQNGLDIHWTTACTNALTAFPSPRHGGENDVFENAALDISGGAHVLLTRNVKLRNLEITEHGTIELNGKRISAKYCFLDGQRLGPGTYAASNPAVAAYFDDASADARGKLVVAGHITMFFIR